MALPVLAAASAFARRVAVNALVNKAKERMGDMFRQEASSGWSAFSYGVFGVTFLGFILMLAVAGGTAGELAGLNNPREPQNAEPCSSLQDPNTMTAADIEAFFTSRNSPLSGTGEDLLAAAQEFNVSPAFMIGIAAAESSLGKYGRAVPNRNPGNIKTSTKTLVAAGFIEGYDFTGHDSENHVIFTNWRNGWRGLAEVLRRNYFDKGKTTVQGIAEGGYLTGDKERWTDNVTRTMNAAVGDCPEEPVPGQEPAPYPGEILPGQEPASADCAAIAASYGRGLQVTEANDREGLPQGKILRSDGTMVNVSPSVCRILVNLTDDGLSPRATCVVCNHTQFVKNSNRESRHWTGQAVDLGNNCEIARYLFERRRTYRIGDLITGACPDYNMDNGQPVPWSYWDIDTQRGHMNHIHVGF